VQGMARKTTLKLLAFTTDHARAADHAMLTLTAPQVLPAASRLRSVSS
jgi:hypothetical protein